ncbi:MAG: hypothetical protein JWM50_1400 [Microbacteriaceae bacterium]|jgi:hypothetical protein|nr:hypothetical protein [Microbacteriaceae bacterium]
MSIHLVGGGWVREGEEAVALRSDRTGASFSVSPGASRS